MKTSQKVVLFLIGILVAVVLLSSCDPAKRISRIVKRNPHLVKTDTVWAKHADTIPAISIDTKFETNKDVSGIDSLFLLLNGKVDSLTRIKLLNETKNYIINRPIITDTLTQVIDGITVKLYDSKGKIGIIIQKPQQIKEKMIPIQVSTLNVAKSLTWSERFKIWMFNNWWWIFLLVWLVWKIFGKALKTYFPWLKFLG